MRADAQRNVDALLATAKQVFATTGVDAPVREIADKAGVGIGTLYRHFPKRSDLVAAVFRREIDECADAATALAKEHAPFDALAQWMQRFVVFFATKRGLASAVQSGDPAFKALPAHFDKRLRPALASLIDDAASAGEIRTDVTANDVLNAVAQLCLPSRDNNSGQAERMVALLADGLRYSTIQSRKNPAD
ncbi:MAG: TetR family transcriptional regulator [Robiginitomaculum sp.]|nr:MAG: TetR family transcriptional regulator [Robiginitomaculum sp.]